ncbi:MAG: hypothetical protein AAFR83_26445, partial [Cyanobacteria bacterium J06629_18]
ALCHGEFGALVNPDDTKIIAQTLIKILQKNSPNTLLYQPEVLRQKVIQKFGFESFQKTLGDYSKYHLYEANLDGQGCPSHKSLRI